jgi:hypothetical protein
VKNKFLFYEVIEVRPKNNFLDLSGLDTRKFDYQTLIGREGVIIGMIQDDDGFWLYDVLFKKEENRFTLMEKDLVSTGIIRKEEEFMSGESIRVRVDPETGEGTIVDDEDE